MERVEDTQYEYGRQKMEEGKVSWYINTEDDGEEKKMSMRRDTIMVMIL